jgi:hypothetical protein
VNLFKNLQNPQNYLDTGFEGFEGVTRRPPVAGNRSLFAVLVDPTNATATDSTLRDVEAATLNSLAASVNGVKKNVPAAGAESGL